MPRGRPRSQPLAELNKPVRRAKAAATLPISDSFAETKKIIATILADRGERGTPPEVLHQVLSWVQAVRAETAALNELNARQRRPKASNEPDRVLQNEMNRALLEGLLDGTITLQIVDDGTFSFTARSVIFRDAPSPSTGEERDIPLGESPP